MRAEEDDGRREVMRQQLEGIEISLALEAERNGNEGDKYRLRARVLQLQLEQAEQREARATDEAARAGLRARTAALRKEAENWRRQGTSREGAGGDVASDEKNDDKADTHTCSDATCAKPGATASCRQCHRAWYCTTACQKRDWPRHKRACRASVAAAARAATRVREATATRAGAARAARLR